MQEHDRRTDRQRLPFYIAYPFSENLGEQGAEEEDHERLLDLCPDSARRLWPKVEELCDRMEYDGSMMYDENPDKYKLRRMAEELCAGSGAGEKGLQAQAQRRDCSLLADLAQLLLACEMHRRRCRRRRHKCHFLY